MALFLVIVFCVEVRTIAVSGAEHLRFRLKTDVWMGPKRQTILETENSRSQIEQTFWYSIPWKSRKCCSIHAKIFPEFKPECFIKCTQ